MRNRVLERVVRLMLLERFHRLSGAGARLVGRGAVAGTLIALGLVEMGRCDEKLGLHDIAGVARLRLQLLEAARGTAIIFGVEMGPAEIPLVPVGHAAGTL